MAQIYLPQLFMQTDPKWAQLLLGNNKDPKFNFYNYACLITCLAMVTTYYRKPENPQQINELLKSVKGFTKDSGNYIWGSITKAFGDINEVRVVDTPNKLIDAQMQEIKASIDSGHPVMVQLDYNPKTVANDTHYVLIIGYNPDDENDFTIADPLVKGIHSLKDYLHDLRPTARDSIYKYVLYEGPKPSGNTVKVTVDGGLRVRKTPHVTADNQVADRSYATNSLIVVDHGVEGDGVNGVNLWWKLDGEEAYIWAGGVDRQPQLTPPTQPQTQPEKPEETKAETSPVPAPLPTPQVDPALKYTQADMDQLQAKVKQLTTERDAALYNVEKLSNFFISLHNLTVQAVQYKYPPDVTKADAKKPRLNLEWLAEFFHIGEQKKEVSK
jgi:hypothetical protein